MRKPVIAMDGYSSTGKSSISKIIAKKLDLVHLDTGSLYRAITYYALKNCLDNDGKIDLNKLYADFHLLKITFKIQEHELKLYLNGENMSQKIRQLKVNNHVSFIAKQPEIREFLLNLQRNTAVNGGIIMDGRDIGAFVLPDADYKFFLTASIEERTKRRFRELQGMGIETDEKTVGENLIKRDKIDSEREVSPLRQAKDAVLIDNTLISKEETIDLILSKIRKF
ncbi:(d)CMP kinase [Halpernia frigidisoli]|uniref:Cytidylate kinase n=1 Tax=Halpernia frigidisoli TaxID=1125876 RepID=A0A1I3EFR0_9FLAO|nr:(d)CMP kinase [Halpernia frigidisoli]SFH97815.1 cytidylate kinase [Halpernia frigidisoli]